MFVYSPEWDIDFSTLDSGLRDETGEELAERIAATNFSTLDSGLRDETKVKMPRPSGKRHFSTLDSGLRDETGRSVRDSAGAPGNFSTLDSGLRDETVARLSVASPAGAFQYPRLGSTR